MPNRAIEFHDSTFEGVREDGTNLTVRAILFLLISSE